MDRSEKKKSAKIMNYSSMHLCHELLSKMRHEYEYDIFKSIKDFKFLQRSLNMCRNNSNVKHYSIQNIYWDLILCQELTRHDPFHKEQEQCVLLKRSIKIVNIDSDITDKNSQQS